MDWQLGNRISYVLNEVADDVIYIKSGVTSI